VPTIRHVAFDVGRVASFGGEERFAKARERWGDGFSAQDFKRLIVPDLGDGVDYWRKLQDGQIKAQAYLSAAARALGFPDTEEERHHVAACVMAMGGKQYEPIARLAQMLVDERGLTIGILTNNNEIMYDALLASGFAGLATIIVSSHEVHMSKPEPEIYRIYLARLAAATGEDVRPDSILFVDDKADNVAAACELGMHGFVFPSRTETMDDALRGLVARLRELSVPVDIGSLIAADA
jgi:putative hydrolase of the HAD superfamily